MGIKDIFVEVIINIKMNVIYKMKILFINIMIYMIYIVNMKMAIDMVRSMHIKKNVLKIKVKCIHKGIEHDCNSEH